MQWLHARIPKKQEWIMKKQLALIGGAFAAALVMSGCAAIPVSNGSPTVNSLGMNLFSEVSANTMIPQYEVKNAKIVKRNVVAKAKLRSFFTAVNLGDASYATLKAEALKQAKGATDLTNIKIDYKMNCICGINTVEVTMYADAIKF